jgi:hypothetical protein
MKRAFIIVLSLLYMASATGATVHVHYCMGKIISLSLSHTEEDICGKCGMKKDTRKKCCKDEYKTFKTNDHRVAKGVPSILHGPVDAVFQSSDHYHPESISTSSIAVSTPLQAPPTQWRKCPIYLLLRSLRI